MAELCRIAIKGGRGNHGGSQVAPSGGGGKLKNFNRIEMLSILVETWRKIQEKSRKKTPWE